MKLLNQVQDIPGTSADGRQSTSGVQLFLSQLIQEQRGKVFYDLPSAADTGGTEITNKQTNKQLYR